jgi:hypothetical protein
MVKRIERFIAASKNLPARRHGPQQMVSLFDHLVGAEQKRLGHFETERFGGLAIQDELEFRYPLDRKTGWIGLLKNPVHEEGRATKDCSIRSRPVRLLPHQSREVVPLPPAPQSLMKGCGFGVIGNIV